MRRHRLLKADERGSAPIEFVFGALFVTFLLFGVMELAFTLYGRNVVASSAHEAARAAIELEASLGEAERVATATVERAAGDLIDGYEVAVSSQRTGERLIVRVRVLGSIDAPGPLPIRVPVDLTATAARETLP